MLAPGASEEVGGASTPIWRVRCKDCRTTIDVVAKAHKLNDAIRARGWWSSGKPLMPVWHCNEETNNAEKG